MTSSSGPGNNASRVPGYDLYPGQVVLKTWEVIEPLGRGGMGAVYRVYHRFLQKEMAMKTLRPDQVTEVTWKRFQTEAKAIAKLVHPNIIQIFDMGTAEEGQPFYTMELLEGQGLDEWIHYEPITAAQAVTVFRQVASALAFAHERGIVHRDIKPANIVLTFAEENKPPVVKVVDFGIAKLGTENQGLTKEGEVFGSPLYMSPEQATGQKVDHRSDIYSFGCALYETLTGFPPFKGKSAMETMMMHIDKVPLPIERARPEIKFPPGLSAIVQMMLAKDPDERYSSASQIAQDLLQIERGMGEKVAYRLQTASQMVQEKAEPDGGQVTQRLTSAYGIAERAVEEEEEELEEAGGEVAEGRPWKFRVAILLGLVTLLGLVVVGSIYPNRQNDLKATASKQVKFKSVEDVVNEAPYFRLDTENQVRQVQKALKIPFEYNAEEHYYVFPRFLGQTIGSIGEWKDVNSVPTEEAVDLKHFPRSVRLDFCASPDLVKNPDLFKKFKEDDIYFLSFRDLDDVMSDRQPDRAAHRAKVEARLREGADDLLIASHRQAFEYWHKMFPSLKYLSKLRGLNLERTKLMPEDMTVLKQLKSLEILVFDERSGVRAADIYNLPAFLKLKYLQVPDFSEHDDLTNLLRKLSQSQSIKTLVVRKSEYFTLEDFKLIGQMTNLESLVCTETVIPAGAVSQLSHLKNLREVDLGGSQCDPENADGVLVLPKLQRLNLANGVNWPKAKVELISRLLHKRNGCLKESGHVKDSAASMEAVENSVKKELKMPPNSKLDLQHLQDFLN